jgi:ubiquinone/menaquinone biosynthesis C-methylase UbiE
LASAYSIYWNLTVVSKIEGRGVSLGQRLPHAVLDVRSRHLKAQKIECLLGLSNGADRLRLLEVGTGGGGIANYFGTRSKSSFEVYAVDVVDNRIVFDGYRFQKISGTELPFADASFDVVISNHVIEHVGDVSAQMHHLAELRRVLRFNGVGYLAVPNRWMLVEPHYRLMFLSWLPPRWRTPYLRAARKGEIYDCKPLQMRELEDMFDRTGLFSENLCAASLKATVRIEKSESVLARVVELMPDDVISLFSRVIPTLIYQFRKKPIASESTI